MKKILVCAWADAPFAVAGATFDRKCSRCSARVMVAPSGNLLLAREPDIEIICAVCFAVTASDDATVGLAATPEELRREVKTAQPNFWRKRN